MPIDHLAGTGRTTRQIEEARHGALFVWCNDRTDYPKEVQHRLGRADVKIVGRQFFLEHLRGLYRDDIVVDHATQLSQEEWSQLQARPCRPPKPLIAEATMEEVAYKKGLREGREEGRKEGYDAGFTEGGQYERNLMRDYLHSRED
jgi:hypothetical protein